MGRFGLLGERLTHSFSPFIHAELGDYEYRLYEKRPDELGGFFASGGFDGINVTIPYKKDVIPYCKSLSKTAQVIGSVNTIIRQPDGTFHGDNTDFYGFAYLLNVGATAIGARSVCADRRPSFKFDSGGKTLVLGGGGSSLTVQAVLQDMNAREVVVISRSGADNYENIQKHYDATGIINTTPVGMYPNNGLSPVDLRMFKHCRAVVDLIYNPARTELLLQAEEMGIANQNGLSMLVAQAKKAAELFTGTEIADSKIEEITAKIDNKTRNIVLIGMPGCGKTSTGKALSEITGREFVDSDDYIVHTAGKPIPDIFARDGEDAFRKIETDVLKELCKRSGLIIATGGGVVTRPENKNIIRQNSVVVFLNRDIAELPVSGRPVSMRDGIEALAAVRLPLYEEWSEFKFTVNGVNKTAEDIYRLIFN